MSNFNVFKYSAMAIAWIYPSFHTSIMFQKIFNEIKKNASSAKSMISNNGWQDFQLQILDSLQNYPDDPCKAFQHQITTKTD